MTRVGSYGQGQALIGQMLRNQQSLVDAQQQVSTGKKAQDFKGVKSDVNVLMGARSAVANVQAQQAANLEVGQKLEIYNSTLGAMANVAEDVRQTLITAVDLNSGTGLMDNIRAAFERASELTNTRYQGHYILGGGNDAQPPMGTTTEAAFIALPSGQAALTNGTQKASARVDDGQVMQYGEVADEVAGPLFDMLQRIMQFENGTLPAGAAGGPAGSFSDPLTAGQRDFLVGEFAGAVSATATVRQAESRNGVNMQTLDQISERQGNDVTFMQGFVSNLEDADPAEAISKLNQAQTSLEASLQLVARIGRMSLLDFL